LTYLLILKVKKWLFVKPLQTYAAGYAEKTGECAENHGIILSSKPQGAWHSFYIRMKSNVAFLLSGNSSIAKAIQGKYLTGWLYKKSSPCAIKPCQPFHLH
jgi:hypothetical protein